MRKAESAGLDSRRRDRPSEGRFVGCQRADDSRHFSDLGKRNASEPGMLADRVLAIGQVDAEGLVAGEIAMLPLVLTVLDQVTFEDSGPTSNR